MNRSDFTSLVVSLLGFAGVFIATFIESRNYINFCVLATSIRMIVTLHTATDMKVRCALITRWFKYDRD